MQRLLGLLCGAIFWGCAAAFQRCDVNAVQENEDELGYRKGAPPLLPIDTTAKCPDFIPEWMSNA